MASNSRSSDGCWTCRLRRKKCDEVRPVCVACSALEIECLYSDAKPDWMDNAEKQKEKADWLKLEVKRLAAVRRERRHMQGLETGLNGLKVANNPAATVVAHEERAPASTARSSSTVSTGNRTGQESGSESPMADLAMSSVFDANTPLSSLGAAPESNCSPFASSQVSMFPGGIEEQELSSLMLYLDYTFPFLNPFYRTDIMNGGRGWLLVALRRNKALFHIALSLTGYMFTEILKHGSDHHVDCKEHNWHALQMQQELAMKELQADIQELNHRGVKGYPAASAHVMSSMIQLLSFEVAIANTSGWPIHLDAATVLFEQIMEHHGTAASGNQCWHRVLYQLGNGLVPYAIAGRNHPWLAAQAAMRFFTAHLIFLDMLAATALTVEPRLQMYQSHLLTTIDQCCDDHPTNPGPHLNMEEYLGVPNWVVLAISATASLAAWKKEQKQTKTLSMTQLVSRAAAIEQDIKAHILELEHKADNLDNNFMSAMDPVIHLGQMASPTGVFPSPQPLTLPGASSASSAITTARIWSQASLTYLSVVVSGWQPGSPEIRESVAFTIAMLQQLSTPASLRTVIWPFCITGCLAMPDEEQGFRDLVSNMGAIQIFGTVREALTIMEHCWEHRPCIDVLTDTWDVASALNCLGHAALLV